MLIRTRWCGTPATISRFWPQCWRLLELHTSTWSCHKRKSGSLHFVASGMSFGVVFLLEDCRVLILFSCHCDKVEYEFHFLIISYKSDHCYVGRIILCNYLSYERSDRGCKVYTIELGFYTYLYQVSKYESSDDKYFRTRKHSSIHLFQITKSTCNTQFKLHISM